MRCSLTAAFLIAAIALPAWCDSREDVNYGAENAGLANQIMTDDPQSYEPYSPRSNPERKGYFQQPELQRYGMAQEHGQSTGFQYRAQATRQLTQDEESALRPKELDDETGEEKGERTIAYQQMKHAGNNFNPYFQRPNMMMNGGHVPNFRPVPKYTMEQQMQMQLQRQQMQQRIAAAQAQAFLHQQHQQQHQAQHFVQPPAQQFAQPQAQQYAQHYQAPAPVTTQETPQVDYLASRAAAPVPTPIKPRYTPPPTPKLRYTGPPTTAQPWPQQAPQQGYSYDDYESTRQKE